MSQFKFSKVFISKDGQKFRIGETRDLEGAILKEFLATAAPDTAEEVLPPVPTPAATPPMPAATPPLAQLPAAVQAQAAAPAKPVKVESKEAGVAT